MSVVYRFSMLGLVFAVMGVLVVADATAYEKWSDGCNAAICHGSFTAAYTSNTDKDGVSWGTDLMSGHINMMLTGASSCDVCHGQGARKGNTFIGSSSGTGGLPGVGCLGCHGRDEPGVGLDGWGLRQHHRAKGMSCSPCHDSDPATGAGEEVLPPYYANPGVFAGIPTHPCNLPAQADLETKFGSWGLDNDGDLAYDATEEPGDCDAVLPTLESTWGRIKALFE